MINHEIRDLFATETKRYASEQNELFYLQQHKIDTFIGIILLTGYNSRPRRRLYRSKDDDVTIPLMSRSRKRFVDIKKFIHLSYNDNLTAGDKVAKIQLLQAKVNASLQQFQWFEKDLSIDEQMVLYFGRHSAKMFIWGKAIRFGYKSWVLASSDGYLCKFGTYTRACKTKDSSKQHGPQVVSNFLSIVEKPVCYRVYFESFFFYRTCYCEIYTRKVSKLSGLYAKTAPRSVP